MKAVVMGDGDSVRVADVGNATVEDDGDAVVRVLFAGVCGSDIHIVTKRLLPPGMRMGHEMVGIVEATGSEVHHFAVGDLVGSPFWITCGGCEYCQTQNVLGCVRGGGFGYGDGVWRYGGVAQGCQAEGVRVPFAEGTLFPLPRSWAAHEPRLVSAVALSDVLPTALHLVTLGDVRPGSRVLVVGDGAIGLLAVRLSRLSGAAEVVTVGHHEDRGQIAEAMGATDVIITDDVADITSRLEGAFDTALATVSGEGALTLAALSLEAEGSLVWSGLEVMFESPRVPWHVVHTKGVRLLGGMTPVRRYIRPLVRMLDGGMIDVTSVLAEARGLTSASEVYSEMRDRSPGMVKGVLRP